MTEKEVKEALCCVSDEGQHALAIMAKTGRIRRHMIGVTRKGIREFIMAMPTRKPKNSALTKLINKTIKAYKMT